MNKHNAFLYGANQGLTYVDVQTIKFVGNNESCTKAHELLDKCLDHEDEMSADNTNYGLENDYPNCLIVANGRPYGQVENISLVKGPGNGVIIRAAYGNIYIIR